MRSLPIELWPAADREVWIKACRPSVRLSRGGAAAHMKPITQADLARRYGYFLDHLDRRGLLDPAAAAGGHLTPAAVEGFMAEVRELWRSVTLAQSIHKLRRMGEILAPKRDFSWLAEIEKDLALVAYPKPRFDRIILTEHLVEAGLTLIREAEIAHHRRRIWRATQMRNGLMVALLALCPIRSKNFASLRLQENFRRVGDAWWIILSSRETKSGRPDERPVPQDLNRAIALYLTWARPILLNLPDFSIGSVPSGASDPFLSGALWAGEKGDALGGSGLDRAIAGTTRMVVGTALSPHDFRRCAATTAAYRASGMSRLASALLQHTDRQVTDEHYNRASSMQASADFGAAIARLRVD